MRRSHRVRLILGAVGVALLASVVPVNHFRSRRAPELANLARLHSLFIACRLHAVDHGGHFAPRLDALIPEYLSVEDFEEARYVAIQKQSGSGERQDWLYYGSHFDDRHPPRVLIAAPQVIENAGQQMRIYLTGDGKLHTSPEEIFQEDLAETMRQRQLMGHAMTTVPATVSPAEAGQQP